MNKNYFIKLAKIITFGIMFTVMFIISAKWVNQVTTLENCKIVTTHFVPPAKTKLLEEKIVPKVIVVPKSLGNDTGPKDASEESITGILWSKDDPEAIIKHRIVRIGDTVDGKKVVDIQEDKVILNEGGKDLEFSL